VHRHLALDVTQIPGQSASICLIQTISDNPEETTMSKLETQAGKHEEAIPLPSEILAALKARLVAQVHTLQDQDGELRGRLAAEESASANTFVAGAEGAMAAETDDEVIALLHHEQAELAAAQAALQRIEQGEYGYCAECGDVIGAQRLQVVPEALLCVSCQDMAEHRKGR
jgi:DnaK suppressor protein